MPIPNVLFALKDRDEPLSASTGFQDDDELFVDVERRSAYTIDAYTIFDSPPEADLRLRFTFPELADLEWSPLGAGVGAASHLGSVITGNVTASGDRDVGGVAVGTRGVVRITGTLVTADVTGRLQLQWSQRASNPGVTTVRKNSWLRLMEIRAT